MVNTNQHPTFTPTNLTNIEESTVPEFTAPSIPEATFRRMAKVIAREFIRRDFRFTRCAILLIQDAMEEYLIEMFQGGCFCANTIGWSNTC